MSMNKVAYITLISEIQKNIKISKMIVTILFLSSPYIAMPHSGQVVQLSEFEHCLAVGLGQRSASPHFFRVGRISSRQDFRVLGPPLPPHHVTKKVATRLKYISVISVQIQLLSMTAGSATCSAVEQQTTVVVTVTQRSYREAFALQSTKVDSVEVSLYFNIFVIHFLP